MTDTLSIPRLYRTLYHLRPEQVLFRLWYGLKRRIPKALPARANPAAQFLPEALGHRTGFTAPPGCLARDIRECRFCFLNHSVHMGRRINWHPAGTSRLWRYHLHYFQFLLAEGGLPRETAMALIRDWIRRNPPGTPDAWDPYPISLRLVNWIKYLMASRAHEKPPAFVVASLHQQAAWLAKHLEFHLLANHLFKNAKALIFAGRLFTGPEAAGWFETGCRVLEKQLDEQILSDGGHFERSPMYHAMILEDCLDLLNIGRQSPRALPTGLSALLRLKAEAMAGFLNAMCHPDGRISLFNDAATGIEARPADLLDYYARVTGTRLRPSTDQVQAFSRSGYYVLAPDPANRLIIDCGDMGPDYQPGHGHCDALSFEISLDHRRVIVDSGCAGYAPVPMRTYNRGNQGHNTLTIDGRDQSEIWHVHRCGRRARPVRAGLHQAADGTLIFKGAHNGYSHLPGSPEHHRSVVWQQERCLIMDQVSGTGRHCIASRLHIEPTLEVRFDGNAVDVWGNGRRICRIAALGQAPLRMRPGWYCPEFGLALRCKVLEVVYADVELPVKMGWEIVRGEELGIGN